jgi:chitosanase
VGESSIALAKLCFPDGGITGDNGHSEKDVLYIGFTNGAAAVPGKDGAAWTGSTSDFESSIKALGDSLVENLA